MQVSNVRPDTTDTTDTKNPVETKSTEKQEKEKKKNNTQDIPLSSKPKLKPIDDSAGKSLASIYSEMVNDAIQMGNNLRSVGINLLITKPARAIYYTGYYAGKGVYHTVGGLGTLANAAQKLGKAVLLGDTGLTPQQRAEREEAALYCSPEEQKARIRRSNQLDDEYFQSDEYKNKKAL